MPLDDLLADGQSYAGATILFAFVQPLEHAENSSEVLRVNSDSVVLHRKQPSLFMAIIPLTNQFLYVVFLRQAGVSWVTFGICYGAA